MILVVDIGGTKIASARADQAGALCSDIVQAPTPATQGAASVVEATLTLLASLRTADDLAVAVSTAGVVDTSAGTVLSATRSISGWGGTPLAALVTEHLGLPTWVLGDGNAFGIGLSHEYGVDALVALIAGTGVGGSIVLGGVPLLGRHHAGGHVGHVMSPQAVGMLCPCGSDGHLEAVASGRGLLTWYLAHGGDPAVTTADELARRPWDEVAMAALATGGAALGAAAAGLVNTLDPDLAVVAGSVARAGPTWESALRMAYANALIPAVRKTPIRVSAHGCETALRGAAHFALRRMNS